MIIIKLIAGGGLIGVYKSNTKVSFNRPIKGNFGVRFVHTDQTAAGNQLNNDQTFSPISVNQNYNNWLPSASMIISPLEQVQLRLGYAQILRRPSFAQLAPTFEYPLNENQA